jgi:hypothetical protein
VREEADVTDEVPGLRDIAGDRFNNHAVASWERLAPYSLTVSAFHAPSLDHPSGRSLSQSGVRASAVTGNVCLVAGRRRCYGSRILRCPSGVAGSDHG